LTADIGWVGELSGAPVKVETLRFLGLKPFSYGITARKTKIDPQGFSTMAISNMLLIKPS